MSIGPVPCAGPEPQPGVSRSRLNTIEARLRPIKARAMRMKPIPKESRPDRESLERGRDVPGKNMEIQSISRQRLNDEPPIGSQELNHPPVCKWASKRVRAGPILEGWNEL